MKEYLMKNKTNNNSLNLILFIKDISINNWYKKNKYYLFIYAYQISM